jgi:hypothetical protein
MKLRLLSLVICAALLPNAAMAQTPAAHAEAAAQAEASAHAEANAHAEAAAHAAAAAQAEASVQAAATARAQARETTAAARAVNAEVERELARAQRELERASSRYAELAQRLAREDIEFALTRPAFSRPAIGIVMAIDEKDGVRLAGITPDSPAAKAGLRSGDRLVRIDGQAIGGGDVDGEERLGRARELLDDLQEGQEVRLAYLREGQVREVTVKAAALPSLAWWRADGPDVKFVRAPIEARVALNFPVDVGSITPFAGCGADGEDCLMAPLAEAYRWRGLRLAALEPKLGRYFGTDRGVLVLTAPQEVFGELQPGDVILSIDKTPVAEMQDAMRLMRGKQPGAKIELEFLRDRKKQRLAIDAPKLARFPPLPPLPPMAPAPPAPPAPPHAAQPPAPPHAPRMSAPMPPAPPEPPTPPEPPEHEGVLARVLQY